jgi:hypothetical protein
MRHAWKTIKMQIDTWQENMTERDELEDLGVNGRMILNGCQRKGVRMIPLGQDVDK